jgi:glyoxylase I family protein
VPGPAPPSLPSLPVRIEPFDAKAISDFLATAGIKTGAIASRYGAEGEGPSIYLEDPEGNVVELKGPPNLTPSA